MLIPAEGTSSLSIGATTDVQGVAAFHTAMGSFVQDGVPDGSWKVLVSKGPVVEGTKTKEEQAAMPEEEWKKYQREIEAKAKKLPPIVPYILGSPSTTPIVLTVAGQKTGLTIDIAKYKDMPEIIRNATKSSPVE
ncbi:MAG: hypothetical protein Q4G69_13000 [Planctomycetia bacterium]|nr:hypothetical protein [Planctomycetia bacterium]